MEILIVWKKYEKIQTFKIMSFLNIFREAKIHKISKTWETRIPILREKYGKTLTFKNFGFLKYFVRSRNPYNFQNMVWICYIFHVKQKSIQVPNDGMSEFPYYRTSMGKHRNSQLLLYLTDLELMKTHAIPNVWECENFHNMVNILLKTISFAGCGFLKKFEIFSHFMKNK